MIRMIRMIRMTNDSELVIQTSKKKKASLISESSKENQTDRQIVNLKRNKKPSLINETPKLESGKAVNSKRKTKPLLINETQEDDRFVTDEEWLKK